MESLGSGLLLSVLASWLVVTLSLLSIVEIAAAAATRSFSFVNECPHEVWVGTQANGGIRLLAEGGFALPAGQKMTLDQVEAGWGGRFWGRTGCTFDAHGRGSCETGDCGGFLKCAGAGGEPPASLAEFTLNGANGDDFYDVSLVDGYNLEIRITPTGGNGTCGSPGCTSNLNTQCPTSLQVLSAGDVVACKSACAAFGTPQYCCTDAYGSPTKCPPTRYSKLFKSACPTAYSYAYDDASSTFTCSGANYQINFCSSSNSGIKISNCLHLHCTPFLAFFCSNVLHCLCSILYCFFFGGALKPFKLLTICKHPGTLDLLSLPHSSEMVKDPLTKTNYTTILCLVRNT
jgi:hypothetical protein